MLTESCLIRPESVKSICDFGAGTGGPSLALRNFFQHPEKRLTLLETNIPQAEILINLLPDCHLRAENGFSALSSSRETYDLITAFMLAPDYEGNGMAESFIRHALPALSGDGKLLICSDSATMRTVKEILCRFPELDSHWTFTDEADHLPVTVVISKKCHSYPKKESGSPELPKVVIKKIDIPEVDGFWTTETYCLSTAFEKSYLHATIKTFELLTPEHPALPYLNDLWLECQ